MNLPTARTWQVTVPASTANLGPGFDCLGVALELYLRLECRPAADFSLELAGEGATELPRTTDNLLVRALLAGAAMTEPPPVTIRVVNEIPLARGLGSSSAATVAGLALGKLLTGTAPAAIDRRQLLATATHFEGHADNAAAAVHGDLVVSGREGNQVVAIRDHWPAELRFVVIVPELTISTAVARQALPATVEFVTAVNNSGRLARLLAALHGRHFTQLATALVDQLHQPYRLPLAPGLTAVLELLQGQPDTLGCYLSGSGPTLVALCTTGGEQIGEAAITEFAAHGVRATHGVLAVDRRGLHCTAT